jgi:hypothetical protein
MPRRLYLDAKWIDVPRQSVITQTPCLMARHPLTQWLRQHVLLLLLPPLQIMHLKNEVRTTLADYKSPTAVYVKGERCWAVDTHVDIALPCATQVRGLQGVGHCCCCCCCCQSS